MVMDNVGNGRIQLILGPMFSGKTTELIRRCKRYQIANYRCAVVKYARDTRYSEEDLATHDQQTLCADIQALKLSDVSERLFAYDVVGIDEGQFFPDLVSMAEALADAGKTVVVAALDGTFKREGFPCILELIPKAEEVNKLSAVCMMCFKDGAFTKRRGQDVTTLEVIGGTETYLAVCRHCHKMESPEKNPEKRALKAQTGAAPKAVLGANGQDENAHPQLA